jgi:preprotein translocase subunit SecD
MGRQRSILIFIVLLVLASIFVIVKAPTQLGLDLQGGAQLTIQVKTTDQIKQISEQQLQAVQRVLEGRVNGLGVSEPVLEAVPNKNQILVQLPGVSDPEQAERVLGGTAQLDFRPQKPGTEAKFGIELQLRQEEVAKRDAAKAAGDKAALADVQAKLKQRDAQIAELFDQPQLTGQDLTDAYPEAPPNSNNWSVGIRFTPQGGEKFAALTKSLAGTGRSLGIFLDNSAISYPVVNVEFAQNGITGGGATITGNFKAEEANDLAVQLRGGSLPLPVEVAEIRTVGATLGRDSIERSIYAAIGGLLLVLIFMILYYRLPGVIASISLMIYAILSLAAFKLLGVTLSLPGIAGFILSIGMAVDANVLIFERTREELRAGKTLYRSVESGFFRAFSSILDSNVTTLIACGALFWLGAGLVRGFALTLALGVVISMFTALTCSRTFLMVALGIQGLRKPSWFCPNLSAANQSSAGAAS